jgi:hypothetical protein
MKKPKTPEDRASEITSRRRRARFLAPAALAALLSGGDGRAEVESEEEGWAASPPVVICEGRLRQLAENRDPEVRIRVAGYLPAAMEWMSGWERTEIIAGWATAASPRLRLAIARALRYAPPAVGDRSAIEVLSRDPDPDVRVAVVEAAWLRRREAPDRFIRVLEALADDPDPMVRSVSHLALGDS